MAIQTITYDNKVALNENPDIADVNKVTDNDMNEIKSVVNNNANNIGDLSSLIVDNNVVGAINKVATYSTTPVKIGEWYDGRDILRRIIHTGAWQQQSGSITIPSTPVDVLVNAFYTFKLSNGRWYVKFIGISNIVYQDATTLAFIVTENLSVADSHIILEYVPPAN